LCLLFRSSWLTVEGGRRRRRHRCCIAGAAGQPWPCRSAWLVAFQTSTLGQPDRAGRDCCKQPEGALCAGSTNRFRVWEDPVLMAWLIRSDEDRIRGFLSRAGVAEREASPTGGLSTESVLVFWGEWQRTLRIYDRNGRQIGEARRVRDRYSKVGYRYHYELWDTELRCVLRDVMRPRSGDSSSHAFSVLGRDEAEIGRITRSGSSNDSYVIAIGGRSVATSSRVPRRAVMSERRSSATPMTLVRRAGQLIDGVTSMVWCIEDEPGHSVARLTSLRGRGVAYVLETEPRLDEQLRTIALTLGIVADNTIIDLTPSVA
jgi:hypothetical protein